MCEIEKEMKELLAGQKPTQTTIALTVQSRMIDNALNSIEKKLDIILKKIEETKSETDKRIDNLSRETNASCIAHKKEINEAIKKLEEETEEIRFAKRHNKLVGEIVKYIIALIVFLAGLAAGHSNFFN